MEDYQDPRLTGLSYQKPLRSVPLIKRAILEDRCILGEIEFAYMLTQSSEFHYQIGQHKRKLGLSRLTARINELYHEGRRVRTLAAIGTQLCNYRKEHIKGKD